MSAKRVKAETFTIGRVCGMILKKEIKNNDHQRPLYWKKLPDKRNKIPSMQEYITHLLTYSTSPANFLLYCRVEGKNIYYNYDGNNRYNAIVKFINEPFRMFPQHLERFAQNLEDSCKKHQGNQEFYDKIKDQLKNKTYKELVVNQPDDCDDFLEDLRLEDSFKAKERKDIWKLFKDLVKKFKYHDKHNDRHINILDLDLHMLTYYGYSGEEMHNIFKDANSKSATFTDNQKKRQSLYHNTDFKIDTDLMKTLRPLITGHYERQKDENEEELVCETFNENTKLNAYDFMIGYEEYARTKCHFLNQIKREETTVPVFIKAFENIFGQVYHTNEVSSFIHLIDKTLELLNTASKKYTDLKIIGNRKSENLWYKSCKLKANKFVMLTAFIHATKLNDKELTDVVHMAIIVNSLMDRNHPLETPGGGHYITSRCKKIIEDPVENFISQFPSREKLKKVFEEEIINAGTNKHRRPTKYFEILLYKDWYNKYMPNLYIQQRDFEIEHLVPYSTRSDCDDVFNRDRTGNRFPIHKGLNRKRGNDHISRYLESAEEEYLLHIKKLIPSDTCYDEIIEYTTNKIPSLISLYNYDALCQRNEEILIESYLDSLFV